MASLRERQKAQRRNLIEGAAGELFVEQGFDDTTIEAIAERALVSPATVYNYYGSKGELLLALVARGEVGIKEKLDGFIALAGTAKPADLLTDVIMSNVDDTLSALSRELWGHVVAFIATTPDPTVAPKYLDTIVDGLAKAIEKVLAHFVTEGVFKPDTDCHYVAYLFTRIERIHFLTYIYLDNFTRDELRAVIEKDVVFILDGIKVQ